MYGIAVFIAVYLLLQSQLENDLTLNTTQSSKSSVVHLQFNDLTSKKQIFMYKYPCFIVNRGAIIRLYFHDNKMLQLQ